MRSNLAVKYTAETHGGSKAFQHITREYQLRRSVMSCLLWESEFYQDGKSIADQIKSAADAVSPQVLAAVAIEARQRYHLRHAPLFLTALLAKRGGKIVGDTILQVIQRADELSEFLSLYWKDKKRPLSKQVKLGLARAFRKFDAYALTKYNRDGAIKLRDVLFMVHAKPINEAQAELWKQLIDGKLPPAGTWEEELSAGKDKRETWTRLLTEEKLGYLALLRNLRNMTTNNVDPGLIKAALLLRKGAQRVLPFRYIAAARACPQLEPTIDQALSEAIAGLPVFKGKTVVLVDVSGSMACELSSRSDLTRKDAAAALASIIPGDVRMFSFANNLMELPPRRGMAGVDAIVKSQTGGTQLFASVAYINDNVPYDRLIVITDEQDTGGRGQLPNPKGLGYMINVASNKNGVGYGAWNHIDGFSENVIRWISEVESDAGRTE